MFCIVASAKGPIKSFMNLGVKHGIGTQYHIRPIDNLGDGAKTQHPSVKVLVAQADHLLIAMGKIKELLGIELKFSLGANLLARIYYQVNKSESVLAVALPH